MSSAKMLLSHWSKTLKQNGCSSSVHWFLNQPTAIKEKHVYTSVDIILISISVTVGEI